MGPPRHAARETRRTRLVALAVVAPFALVTLVALVWLWPQGDLTASSEAAAAEIEGQVTSVVREACPEPLPDDVNGCGTAEVALADDQGEVTVRLPNGVGAPEVAEGDDVVLISIESPDGETYEIVDHQRDVQLGVLLIVFCLALLAFGRWRGLRALLGLAVTFGVLLLFIVPAILRGEPPLLVAIAGSAAIMLVVLYLTHGFGLSTTIALLGTLVSLALTGVLAAAAVAALHLTGITDDISMSVGTTYDVDMAGLLLAGIVIGSLGVLDDVTVTQAVTVGELARANPKYGVRQLYRAADRVGRSHIASVVNTIVLAYAGASLPLLVLTVAENSSIAAVASSQFIAQEIVRSVVATLGLVAAVPITTGLAAWALRPGGSQERVPVSEPPGP